MTTSIPILLASAVVLLVAACSGGAPSSEASNAILDELHAIPGAVEVGRSSKDDAVTRTYRIEDAPAAAVTEFYLASLPAEWELTEPLGDAPEVVAFCRDGSLLRIDASGVDRDGTFTLEAQIAGSEECG